jgi:hypothetical protein
MFYKTSVADTGRIQGQKDPGSGYLSKDKFFLTQTILLQLSEIKIRDEHPGYGS